MKLELNKVKRVRDNWLKHKLGITFYDYQKQISDQLIEDAFLGDNETPIEVSRQAGKTTAVVATVAFVIYFHKAILGKGIRIGIFAPQKEQAKTDFDRLKEIFMELKRQGEAIEFNEYNATTLRPETMGYTGEEKPATLAFGSGNEIYIFPVSKTSNPESKTLDWAIIEEAQDVDDTKLDKAVIPMLASTNGAITMIGTAGYRICKFYRLLQKKDRLIFDYEKVIKDRKKKYEETKDDIHLNYENFIKRQMNEMGADSEEFRSQFCLEWILGAGQFITKEHLDQLHGDFDRTYRDEKSECYAGIDTAKMPDETWVTVLKKISDREKHIANWLVLRGDNYADQFEIIYDFLKNYNIRAVAIDSTGQGDFMPDMFERNTRWTNEGTGLFRVKFNLSTKDIMYKNLMVVTREFLTKIPTNNSKLVERFREQMLDLQKEYKGEFLSCHHPDVANAHDDACDSWALAEYAYYEYNKIPTPNVSIIEEKQEKKVNDFLTEFDDDF